jgi:hypothetical protein
LNEAETHDREAVLITKHEIGNDSANLPGYLAALASLLVEEGQLTEAQLCAEEAVGICQRHPDQIERWQQKSATEALDEVTTKLGAAAVENR